MLFIGKNGRLTIKNITIFTDIGFVTVKFYIVTGEKYYWQMLKPKLLIKNKKNVLPFTISTRVVSRLNIAFYFVPLSSSGNVKRPGGYQLNVNRHQSKCIFWTRCSGCVVGTIVSIIDRKRDTSSSVEQGK